MSLRHRLALSMTLLCLALLSLSGAATYAGARRTLLGQLDQTLLAVTRTEVASAMDGPRIHLHDTLGPRSGYQRYAQIVRPGGAVLAQSDNLPQPWPRRPDLERTEQPLLADLEVRGYRLRAVYFPLENEQALAVIALSRAPIERALSNLSRVLTAVLLGGGAVAAGLSWWLARRLTRPLEELAREAHLIEPHLLSTRLEPQSNEDREVTLLREALNTMLAHLEQAFSQQQRFLADASHELRTPLTNLIGHLEVTLRKPREAAGYRECLERSLAESQRLGRLVSDLLMLGQSDQQALHLSLQPVRLSELLSASREGFERTARLCNVKLVLEVDSGLSVSADPNRLRQVVDNLLDNALRYAPAGTSVRLSACSTGEELELAVSDAGPGLTPTEQQELFQRFSRPDRSRSRSTGGTGLGLAIVRDLVQAHGGRVWVESQPGQGARFVVRLPGLSSPTSSAGAGCSSGQSEADTS